MSNFSTLLSQFKTEVQGRVSDTYKYAKEEDRLKQELKEANKKYLELCDKYNFTPPVEER